MNNFIRDTQPELFLLDDLQSKQDMEHIYETMQSLIKTYDLQINKVFFVAERYQNTIRVSSIAKSEILVIAYHKKMSVPDTIRYWLREMQEICLYSLSLYHRGILH